MPTQKLSHHLEKTHYSLYGNFGARFAAGLLDGLIFIPLALVALFFDSLHLYYYYNAFVFTEIVIMAYCIYLPVRYGATPGKRIMGLTILKTDGSAITYRESFLKYLPLLILALLDFYIQSSSIALADATVFDSMGLVEQLEYLESFNPIPEWTLEIVILGYYFTSMLLVLLNPRKRSLSDLLAGTVVVNSRCLEKIKEL
ncbi:RDD family protein [Flavobacterium sp. J49]|uniref:RDD family protein n=1 Tax=Flavobacterium sp. J49 TaxID=2718534 RepID=UPI001592BE42|nr:RDD family protein [Flavobacterium sp. J49]MBF6642178.1 RDD family protein [Flavobacterium sp. J49]NIC03425.1 RDD family protein [Flavobacterium sp. J49]